MTATTRRISEHNLHERLALEGPSDELKDLGDTIDGLLARLEAAFEAQRRFVANASHELRTPLSMMRTSLDVAAAKPGPAPRELEALDGKLREGLDRADRLLESFLTLARAQRGAVPEQAAVALRQVVSGVLADRGGAIEAKGIEVDRKLEDVNAIGSETLLAHLVDNVIDNAIRHNEPRGWIRVETEAGREAARLVVESSGRRLDPTEVRELAQPFRRLGTERTNSQNGVGLGLSIVAAIADAHGGELELEARAEGGLRVRIELPRAQAGA
jgi:signal transduction histidine kinase